MNLRDSNNLTLILKAKEKLCTIVMEISNIAGIPPWKWWSGGPPNSKIVYDLKTTEDDSKFETWLCTLTLSRTNEVKNQIDTIYNQGTWDDYKKITNPFEYIFLSLNRRMSRSVTTRVPLSRSYFKMLEMWKGSEMDTELALLIHRDGGLLTAHAAEGPGGFIEAIHDATRVKYTQAMTLRSTTRNIPGWRKTMNFLQRHPQVNITYGVDDTGDLLKLENIDYFLEKQGHAKAHIYTADGGFDFSSDFNAQEETILPLLTAEFYLGLKSIQRGGIILVKIFDTILRPTLELVWIVTRCFREWTIVKPRTSRGGNAERYLICKGFLGLDSETDEFFRTVMTKASNGYTLKSFLETRPDTQWIQTMLTIQELIAKQETDIILQTLDLIETPNEATIRGYIEENVERSLQWCLDYNEPINKKWYDDEWKRHTIDEEIRELVGNSLNSSWRGADSSRNGQQELFPRQQRHHAVLFSRSQSSQAGKGVARARRGGSPDEEGWQKV